MIPQSLMPNVIMRLHNPVNPLVFLLIMAIGHPQLYAQPETDVYLAHYEYQDGVLKVYAPTNISQNPGYDNQPFFLNNSELVYSRTRNGQTDIAKYGLSDQTTTWLSDTPSGSEYSPMKIPETLAVSSIRLDTTGLQRLYSYPLRGGLPELLIPDLKIGYQLWYNADVLVCTVLIADRMDLVVVNLNDKTQYTYQKNVGRSLHRIPGSDLISYIALEDGAVVVKSMNPLSGATQVIAELPKGVQDMCWLGPNRMICGQGHELLLFDIKEGSGWKQFYALKKTNSIISRLACHPESGNLAMVIEITD